MRSAILVPLALAALSPPIPALGRPVYDTDLDPRNVNPANPTPLRADAQIPFGPSAVTVFTVSMSADRECAGAHMLVGAYNTSNTGCIGTRGPGFGSMRVLLAEDGGPRTCRAKIYATASCEREVGVAEVGEEGVCVYTGMGQVAAGWSVECTAA